ncbi:MAG: metallophosphoesterase [Gammaproteobacteria bacterium]|nr:metallophosphoesterase [Gammaproteobacteria bacterium]
MKRTIAKPLTMALGLTLGSCILPACNSDNAGDVAASNNTETKPLVPDVTRTITFIHMNDLHAHLTEHYDYIKTDENTPPKIIMAGGIARIATAIKSVRDTNPGNSILMNIGDTYHGGVEALYTNGNAVVDIMNEIGVDIGVPGNWDFAYGPNATRQRFSSAVTSMPMMGEITKVNYPNLAANVTSTLPRNPFLPATKIITLNGAKIGFIGLSSDIVPKMSPALAVTFNFLQGEQNHIDLVNKLAADLRNQGVNIVVVMSELGIHKDLKLGEKIKPGSVDVFFSAHTHELTRTPVDTASGAKVVEAGDDIYLGKMDITLVNGKVSNRAWNVITVDNQFSPDQNIANLVVQKRAPFLIDNPDLSVNMPSVTQSLHEPITEVIAQSPVTIDRRQALENNFNKLFSTMLKNYANTDVAITPGFRFDAVIPGTNIPVEDQPVSSGNITIEDMYRYFPVPFILATGEIAARENTATSIDEPDLQTIIENNLTAVFSTDVFKQGGGWTDAFAGLNLQVNLKSTDGYRVTGMKRKGSDTELTSYDMLSVAGCQRPVETDSSTLCSYPGFSQVTALINPATGSAWSGIDFAIAEIRAGHLPASVDQDITDTGNTTMWPNSMYIQPLYGAQ